MNLFFKKREKQSANRDSFEMLGLSKSILTALQEKGYEAPTKIQLETIPEILKGRDLLAVAQTGTGKTAGFTLPILEMLSKNNTEKNNIKALILAPTRELAYQILDSVNTYGKHLPFKSTVVVGGVNDKPQKLQLKKGVDILVATPGRLLDLYNQKTICFSKLEILVLDEADRMLDMGFIHDIKKIVSVLPKIRQNVLFSATFSKQIRQLANSFLNQPKEISVSPKNSTANTIKQAVYKVSKTEKKDILLDLIQKHNWYQVLIFTQTKHGANKLTKFLDKGGITASAIHGNKSQSARNRALSEFKSGKLQALVATDIASRGLDISELPQVVNFELPHVPEDYVHRIGRTGRAGVNGAAISLVCDEELRRLSAIEKLIKKKIDTHSLNNNSSKKARFKSKRRV
jgi:ATP-dependent RNA helicase RhlE